MKKLLTSAFCLAIMAATPAYAQSAFVMVIGDAPTASPERASTAPSREERAERAIENACARPSVQSVKMQSLYRECVAEMQARMAENSEDAQQIAAR